MKNSPFFCKGFIKLCGMSFFSTVCLIPTCYSLSFNKVNPIIQILIFLPRELQKAQNRAPCGRRGSIRIIFKKCKAIKVLFRTLPVHLEPMSPILTEPFTAILHLISSWLMDHQQQQHAHLTHVGKWSSSPFFPLNINQPNNHPTNIPSWVPKLIQRGQQLSFRPGGSQGEQKTKTYSPKWWFSLMVIYTIKGK